MLDASADRAGHHNAANRWFATGATSTQTSTVPGAVTTVRSTSGGRRFRVLPAVGV